MLDDMRGKRVIGVAGVLAGILAVASAATIELRSGDGVLGLDGATGSVVRFADAGRGLEFAGGGEGLFRLVVIPRGGDPLKPLELSSREAKAVRRLDGEGLRLRFERIGGRDLSATCTVEAGAGGFFRFRIGVEGDAGTILERVDYPLLPLRAPLEGDGAGDALVLGTTKGGVLERPHQWKNGRYAAGTQPGNLAAQFGCYYGPEGGVVTFCEDGAGHPKTLAAGRMSDGLALGWRHLMRRDLKDAFALSFPVAVGVFRGTGGAGTDWRDAAAMYKAWALKQPWCATRFADREDLPGWLKEGPAQVRFGRDWLGRPERIEGWLEKYWQKHFAGVPLVVTFWGWEGVATWVPPKYLPPYPSEEGLKRCVDAVRRAGGHAFFWPSGYQWCLTYGKREDGTFEWEDRAWFEREARAHAMVGKDGKVMLTNPPWYRGGEAATLCRGDKWSRDWLTGLAVALAERGGELFQIDQVVGAGMRGGGDCRATGHGHPPGIGIWDVDAAHKQMSEMLAACRAAGVNMVLGYEEPQELFLQEVGIQDYRDYEVVWKAQLPEHRAESVFGYLYHEFVPLFQSNPRAESREMTAHCIVTGQMPHLVPHWPVEPYGFPTHGGFEEWEGEVPVGWEHVRGWKDKKYAGWPHRDDGVRRTGASSLRIESATPGELTQVSRNLPVGAAGLRAGGKYRVSAWCRVERLAKPSAIGLAALGKGLSGHGSWRLEFPAPGDWREVSADVVIPAEGADLLRVMINAEGPCRLWVDDFSVAELGDDGAARPIVREGLPPQHELYRQWIGLYHGEGRPYLQHGEAVPPPNVEPCGAVRVGAFRAADGSEAVIAVNDSDSRRMATLQKDGWSHRVELAPMEVRLIRKSSGRPSAALSPSAASASPYGVCAHLARGGEFALRDEALRLMRAAGIAWARSDFDWAGVQPKPDAWAFAHLDAVLDSAERAGVQMLPILDYSVSFANPAHQHLDRWEQYVLNLVNRYHARLPVWEVWNEQNLEGFWKDPSADAYLPLLKKTYEAVKSVDPDLRVAVGGHAGVPLDYIERLYALGGGRYFDLMNVHPYNHPSAPEESLEQRLGELRALMARHGDADKPIWITEIGWPTQKHRLAAPGVIRAGLAAARPGHAGAWRILVLDDPAYSTTSAPSDSLLADELPASAQVHRLNVDALLAALDENAADAVILPFDERFPADGFDRLRDFVRRGGILIECGGMPFWEPLARDANGAWSKAKAYGESFRDQLRIGVEAWWYKKGVIPEKMPVTFVGPAAANPPPEGGIEAERFLTPNKLKPGDRFIPLLSGRRGDYTGAAAAVYKYGSDLTGAVIACALFERGQRGSTLAQQAKYLPRAYLIAMRLGVERVFWYEFQAPETDALDQESHFGIVHRDLAPKPAYLAYRTLVAQRPAGSITQERPWRSEDGAYYYPQWTRPDGQPAGAIWAYQTGGPRRLTFSSPDVIITAHTGEPVPARWQGRTCVLPVSDAPLYFAGAALESIGE